MASDVGVHRIQPRASEDILCHPRVWREDTTENYTAKHTTWDTLEPGVLDNWFGNRHQGPTDDPGYPFFKMGYMIHGCA